MIDRDDMNKETKLQVFLDYLRENYPDMYPLNEDVTEFKRGHYAGIIEIQRFLVSVCEPTKEK